MKLGKLWLPLTVLAMLLAGLSTAAWAGDVVLIANPDVQEASLSKSEVGNIFLGKKKSLAGGSVKIAVQKDKAVTESFLGAYVGKTPSQFSSYYKKLVFSGKGKPPKKVSNDAAMLAYVAKTSGAVGYVSAGAENDTVKVVTVN